jgi:hypothetical protein
LWNDVTSHTSAEQQAEARVSIPINTAARLEYGKSINHASFFIRKSCMNVHSVRWIFLPREFDRLFNHNICTNVVKFKLLLKNFLLIKQETTKDMIFLHRFLNKTNGQIWNEKSNEL